MLMRIALGCEKVCILSPEDWLFVSGLRIAFIYLDLLWTQCEMSLYLELLSFHLHGPDGSKMPM